MIMNWPIQCLYIRYTINVGGTFLSFTLSPLFPSAGTYLPKNVDNRTQFCRSFKREGISQLTQHQSLLGNSSKSNILKLATIFCCTSHQDNEENSTEQGNAYCSRTPYRSSVSVTTTLTGEPCWGSEETMNPEKCGYQHTVPGLKMTAQIKMKLQ